MMLEDAVPTSMRITAIFIRVVMTTLKRPSNQVCGRLLHRTDWETEEIIARGSSHSSQQYVIFPKRFIALRSWRR